jgi:hypothetical protein
LIFISSFPKNICFLVIWPAHDAASAGGVHTIPPGCLETIGIVENCAINNLDVGKAGSGLDKLDQKGRLNQWVQVLNPLRTTN